MPKQRPSAARAEPIKPNAKRLTLGPGLHAGLVELRSSKSLHVRLLDDRRVKAVVADGVDPGLLDECLRQGKLVILADTPRGPTIVGALQTARAVSVEPDGTVALEGKAIRIRADKAISLETGASAVRLEESGRVRAEGHRMVIDMSSNVRVLSALVELP